MVKGHIVNNTAKSRHMFKRTIYPGQSISLADVYSIFSTKQVEDVEFLEWVRDKLPIGWELKVEEDYVEPYEPSRVSSEEVLASVQGPPQEVHVLSGPDDDSPSLEYAPAKTLDKLTARDIYNLRIKDNPKRVIKQIDSVHKLRRALSMCKNDSRKSMLATIIRHRIKEISG